MKDSTSGQPESDAKALASSSPKIPNNAPSEPASPLPVTLPPLATALLSSSPSTTRGPRLLLFSIAGISTSVGLTCTRWILSETGQVMLLLFARNEDNINGNHNNGAIHTDNECEAEYAEMLMDGMDPDLILDSEDSIRMQCNTNNDLNNGDNTNDNGILANTGITLLRLSSSPYLRAAPLLLLFISSTALLVGIIWTRSDFQMVYSQCVMYGKEYWKLMEMYQMEFVSQLTLVLQRLGLVVVVAEEEGDNVGLKEEGGRMPCNFQELTTLLKEKQIQLKYNCFKYLENTIECIDELILDDTLRKYKKAGNELFMGVAGGMVLYSIPEEIFPMEDNIASATLQRLVADGETSAAAAAVAVCNSSTMDSLVKIGTSATYESTVLPTSDTRLKHTKQVRQRLIRAVDPSLEQAMFRPGGLWDLLPLGWRESLLNMAKSHVDTNGGHDQILIANNKCLDADAVVMNDAKIISVCPGDQPTHDSTEYEDDATSSSDVNEEEDGSSDTPQVSPPSHIHVKRVNIREKTAANQSRSTCAITSDQTVANSGQIAANKIQGEGPRETITEALMSTIRDVVASNLTLQSDHSKEELSKQRNANRHSLQHHNKETPPPTPYLHLETILNRTAAVAALLFLFHLRNSHTTRKAWWSAAQFSASLGLVGTAIGSGFVSNLLSSTLSSHPIMGIICTQLQDGLKMTPLYELPLDFENRARCLLRKIREEVKKNRRLQATLALMVFYGIKRLPVRNRIRNVKRPS